MMVSVDGYFEGINHDLSWHNAKNEEFKRLAAQHAVESDAILMGYTTFQLMRDFWPTKHAYDTEPATAKFMNETQKYVVSHSNFEPGWNKVTVIHTDVFNTIRTLKSQNGKNIALLGSNNLCVSLMKQNLVDEFRIMVNPVAIGAGTPLFYGFDNRYPLTLAEVRKYNSGNVMMRYKTSNYLNN